MKLAQKLIIITSAIILFVIASGLILQFTLLPGLVQKKIIRALNKSGLSEAQVKVKSVTYWGADLENLNIGLEKKFQIKKIKVSYSLRSLINGKVNALYLYGAKVDFGVKNRALDLGLLSRITGGGKGNETLILPFANLYLKESTLLFNVEGQVMMVPLEAAIKTTGNTTGSIDLQARVESAKIKTSTFVDMDKKSFDGTFGIKGLDLGLLQLIGKLYPSLKQISGKGKLNANGHIVYQDGHVTGTLTLTGDRLLIKTPTTKQDIALPFYNLTVKAAMDPAKNITMDLSTFLCKTPVTLEAAFNMNTFSGKCVCHMDKVDNRIVKILNDTLLPDYKLQSKGFLRVEGNVVIGDKKGSAELEFKGSGFELQTRVGGYDLNLAPVSLKSKTAFAIDSGNINMTYSLSTLKVSRIFNASLGITAKNLNWSLPYDWKEKKVTQGSMTIEAVDVLALSLAKITSSFQFNKNELTMKVKSSLGPWATANATGNLYFDPQGLTGVIAAKVPEFTTQNKKWLAGLIPPIKDDALSGTLSADARLKIEKGNILQQCTLDLKDVEWKKSGTDTGIQGITGVLGLNSFAPLITDGEQSFTFRNAHTGTFKVENGQTIFNFVKNDIIYIKSMEMNWAGGRLSSKNIQLEFSKPQIAFDLNVEALNLQDILDFMEYQGVKGDGRIYGHVPLTVNWEKHPRLSFSDGYLEAIPPKGGLQFSKTTAMKILGIEKEIDPKTKNKQEIVSLMMLRALQDMEYSQLKMVFKNDENNVLKTRVQAKGYGPRNQKENRVPIGGLDITISNLDELLNRMVIPQLMRKK